MKARVKASGHLRSPCYILVMGIFIPLMGMINPGRNPLQLGLLSPVQARLLGMMFGQPERTFQSAELIRLVGRGTGAVHRQLKQMTAAGLFTETSIGNQRHYQANRQSPIFEEIRNIVLKTVGLAQPLREGLEPLKEGIRFAFVFGSVAKGSDRPGSDVDLMVVSDTVDYPRVYEALQAVEVLLSRRINPTVMTRAEWREKQQSPESFVSRVLAGPRIWVIGGEGDLG